ncbi:MAG TPA: large conductance mechanosensitive channel protein MscL [Planctomycetota bacterium]|jgi:large conductance mechanosensitive channel
MKFWKEFKEFAMKGSVVDLAVAFILGVAFGKVVSSFVGDILMPPIGMLAGHVDFSNLFVNLGAIHYNTLAEAKAAGAPTLNYGAFINTLIDFLLMAAAVFVLVKMLNAFRKRESAQVTTKKCEFCGESIPIEAHRCPHCTTQLDTWQPKHA